ncbi:hypothetical protein [Flavobacterium sp.]|uniref:hypothetical protein n=1 Tax=Flavobacterium sp. TaxID=239 RepID=UPI0026345D6E|nr:hypothetical protein [Flavobacterium sp.]
MDKILNIGKYLFPLSFLLYVGLHFGNPVVGASFVPYWLPFPTFLNYFAGILILAFIVSCLIGKFDKLATVLMALYVLLMIFLVHIPRASTSENDMLNIFRNIMIIGALLIYAKYATKDNRLIG